MISTKVMERAFTALVLGMAIAAFYMGACGGSKSDSGSSASASTLPVDTYVIYFENANSWTVYANLKKVPVGGGTPVTIDTDVVNWEFTPDRTKIVYEQLTITTTFSGALKSVAVSGGSPTTLATNVRDWKISPDGTKIFCVANYNTSTAYGDLITIPISGGSPTTLVSGGYSLKVKQDIIRDASGY